jgi:hypothetical protein
MDNPYGPGKSWFLVNEEQLREKIVELSPEIHRDTGRMEDLIREMVKLEREKAGLDDPRGNIELSPYKKKGLSDPDLTGAGRIAGRDYRVAGWISKNGNLRIGLLPPRRK